MTPYEYYSNLIKYKKKDVSSKLYGGGSLEHGVKSSIKNLATHANTMKNYGYYNKLDNFYGPGKARYFYSKDEWDAYQREKDALLNKARDEVKYGKEIKADKEKHANVYKAQEAREKAAKDGMNKIRTEQALQVYRVGNDTDKVLDSFLHGVKVYCSGDKKELDNIIQKYSVTGEMSHNNYVKDPEWNKLYNAHVANYHSDDPGYSNASATMTRIQNEYQAKRAQEMCQDIIRYVRNNATPNNYYWIMKNPYVQKVLDGDIKTYDSLARMFRSLNADRAETWDNSKNIKTWDNGTTLYEDILKEKKI